ncbi:hypothetical protein M2475_000596, partial [Breznakia sp. PF5-3]|uniref:immunoglobulin-like domain-containing protein n=1 Tax=unclassified Breznakia TaxID=2623764 RepID=UPI0024069AE5
MSKNSQKFKSRIEMKIFKVFLSFVLFFTSIGISSLVADVLLVSNADDVEEVEKVEEEEQVEEPSEEEETSEETPPEEEAEEEEEDLPEKQTYDRQTRAGPVAIVGSWAELVAALNDTDVSEITFSSSISRGTSTTRLPAISRDLVINGNNKTLDFGTSTTVEANYRGFELGNVTTDHKLEIKNLNVNKIGRSYSAVTRYEAFVNTGLSGNSNTAGDGSSAAKNSIHWTVHFDNVNNNAVAAQNTASSLASVENGTIVLSGNVNWATNYKGRWEQDHARRAGMVIRSKDVHVTASPSGTATNVKLYANNTYGAASSYGYNPALVLVPSNVFANSSSGGYTASLVVDSGSNLYAESQGSYTPAVVMNIIEKQLQANETSTNGAKVQITGGSTASLVANRNGYEGAYGGTLSVAGRNASAGDQSNGEWDTREATISVDGGSTLNLEGKKTTALTVQVTGGKVRVAGQGSKLNVDSATDVENIGTGGDFNSSYANSDGIYAAIRFRWVGNQILHATDGGVINVRKHTGNAMLIRFGKGENNSFYATNGGRVYMWNAGDGTPRDAATSRDSYNAPLQGYNKGVEYDASGFTFQVEGEKSSVEIYADNGAAIDATGHANGTINIGKGSIFVAKGQTGTNKAAIFKAGANTTFNMDEPIYYDFANTRDQNNEGGAILDLGSGSTFDASKVDMAVWKKGTRHNGNATNNWPFLSFSLSGTNLMNVNSTRSDFLDKYLGISSYSRMNGNNAQVIITNLANYTPENADKYVFFSATVPEGMDQTGRAAMDDEVYVEVLETKADGTTRTLQGVSATDTRYDGVNKQGLIKVDLKGEFALPGTKYEVISAYRGNPNEPEQQRHSEAQYLQANPITVVDTTPPLPVKLDGLVYANTKTVTGTWDIDAIHNNDKPVKLTVTLNGTQLAGEGTLSGEGTSGNAGKWSYTFPNGTTLKEGDVLQFFVEDAKGNKNPAATKTYHDTTLNEGTKVTVTKVRYEVIASDVIVGKEDAKLILTDADLKSKAKASGRDVIDSKAADIIVLESNYKPEPGTYKVTFAIEAEQDVQKTVTFKVLPFDEVIVSDNYVLAANNVSTYTGEAKKIADSTSYAESKLKELSGAKAWAKSTVLSDSFDPATTPSVGVSLSSHTVVGSIGLWDATFAVTNETSTKLPIDVRVINGSEPKLTVEPTYMNIPVGGTYDYTYGVSAIDDEDGDLTSKVTSTGTVNVNAEGVYIIVYTVTDKDHNSVSKTRVVTVGDYIPGEKYFFKVNNFVILKKDVKGTDAEILEKTGAQAWVMETGLPVPTSDLEVRNNGGYKAEVGDYKTTISVKGATSAKDKVEPTAKVVDGNVIDEGDKYTLVASNIVMTVDEAKTMTSNAKLIDKAAAKAFKKKDLSAGTVKVDASGTNFKAEEGDYKATFYVGEEEATRVEIKIKVIDGDIIDHGDEYTIVAKHVQLTRSQAEALTDNDLISRAKAKAFKRDDMSVATVAVTHDVGSTVGTYSATYHVVEEPTTKVDADVKVINGSEPRLTVEPAYMNIPVGGTYDYTYGVSAIDDEDGDLTSIVKPTGTVNVNEEGVYPIVYTVTDNDHNTVSKTRVVTVGDIIPGEDYLFKASNYVILKKDVKGTDAEILEKTGAQAWVKETGLPVPTSDLEVKDNGGYKAQVGDYKTIISVKGATSTKDKVEPTAKVVDGNVI